MKWTAFLNDAPERVVTLIEHGPMPLKEYGSDRFNYLDKKHGLVPFKGGNGRGHINMKSGMAAVVHFDPNFITLDEPVENIPDDVMELHSEEEILAVFERL